MNVDRDARTYSPPPPDEPPRRRMKMLPWWRRLSAWLKDFHHFALTLVSVGGMTVAGHAWVRGLITKEQLATAVEEAVRKAMVDQTTEIKTLKERTGGLPEWRSDFTKRLSDVELRAAAAERKGEKNEDRIDRYIARARGGGG